MKRLSRANALKIAAVLSLLLGLLGVVLGVPLLERGAAALNQGIDTPPYAVLVAILITAAIRIASAYGVWLGQRWAVILTLLVSALDGVFAVPGVLFAPTSQLWAIALGTVISNAAIVMLCLWRDRKVLVA